MTGFDRVDDGNIGERRERAKRTLRFRSYVLLFALGVAIGFVFAVYEGDDGGWANGTIPPAIAVVLAALTFVAMVGGCLYMKRRVDEVELQHNLYAGAWAAIAVMIGYPVWFLLWKGQLVPEPSHLALFVALYSVMTVTYLYRKFR